MSPHDVLPWVLLSVVVASVVYELASGRSLLRGVGDYRRADSPRAYWASVALKVFVGLAIVAAMLTQGRPH